VQGEDTNTGVFFPAADTVAVATGGSERLRVESSGDLLLGTTTSPSSALVKHVNAGDGVYTQWTRTQTTIGGGFIGVDGPALIFGTHTGNVGAESYSERARIDSSGNLLVGATSYNGGVEARLTVVNKAGNANNSVASFKANATTTATTMLSFYDGGDTFCGQIFINPSADTTSYATSSDYRLKEDVQPMTGGLERVLQLKPCTYTWKKSGSVGEGFIAHELAEVCPAAVIGEKDAVNKDGGVNPQMIDTSFLVATLVAAIKELKAEVDSLKAQLEAN
jgi:hypothetical protein